MNVRLKTLALLAALSSLPGIAAAAEPCKQLEEIVQLTRRKIVLMNEHGDYQTIGRRLDRLRVPREIRTNPTTHVDDITLFMGVDLDRDGKAEKIYRECGDDGIPSCRTTVTLTRGGTFEAWTTEGYLYRLKGRIYAVDVIIGHYGKRYKYNAHIYAVTQTGYRQICRR